MALTSFCDEVGLCRVGVKAAKEREQGEGGMRQADEPGDAVQHVQSIVSAAQDAQRLGSGFHHQGHGVLVRRALCRSECVDFVWSLGLDRRALSHLVWHARGDDGFRRGIILHFGRRRILRGMRADS